MHPEVEKQVRKEFGIGGAEPAGKIYHCANPKFPHFEFEWHPGVQKVYRIDLPGKWVDKQWVPAPAGSHAQGRCIAEHCLTHAMFLGFVQTFLRGYALAMHHHGIKETDPCPIR